MKLRSDKLKIGLVDITLLIVLNIAMPSADVFSDFQSSATFFLTGRNCYYTDGEKNWTYNECEILPTLVDNYSPTRRDLDGTTTTPITQSGIKNTKLEEGDTSNSQLDEAEEGTTAIPSQQVYVRYAPYKGHTKYAFDLKPSQGIGWKSLLQFWAFDGPINGSTIPLHVGTSFDYRYQLQKGHWTNNPGWKNIPGLVFHVMKYKMEGMTMYTLSQAADGRSRILDCDAKIINAEEWKEDITFWAKKEPLPLVNCCNQIAILTSGHSSAWRVDYLGKYNKGTSMEKSSFYPCQQEMNVRYTQKLPGQSILSRWNRYTNHHEREAPSIRWAVTDKLGDVILAETLENEEYACPADPDKTIVWSYSTSTKRKCLDETLNVLCIEDDAELSIGNSKCKQGLKDGTVTSKCDGKPYTFFGWMVIFPTILTTLATLKVWWEIEETTKNRLLTLPLLLFQIWPQYRAVIIILYGLKNNEKWICLKEKQNNEITSIEPVYESVLQVNVTGSILITTAGPWYDNINNLYLFPLASSLWSFFISLFTASFGIAKFLRVGPVRFLPDGWLEGLFTWTFLSAFVATLATVFLKAFWLGIVIKRLAIGCAWSNSDLSVAGYAIAIGFTVFYLPNIIMTLQALVGGIGMRKTLSIITRIPVLVLIPAFSPFTFGLDYKRSSHICFSRSLTFINVIIILLQTFIAPYIFIHNTSENHEIIRWFYTDDIPQNQMRYHSMLIYSLMACLPLLVVPTLLLISPRLPRCQPHLDIKTLNIQTWQNENIVSDGNVCDNSAFEM